MRWPCTLILLAGCCSAARSQQHAFVQWTTQEGLAQSQVRCMAQDAQGYLWFGTLGGASRFDGLQFTNYALQEGLPEAQVNAMVAEPGGGLWLGAGASLVRFDGHHMVPVPLPSATEDSRILALALGTDGRLYIGTDGAGVLVRDGSRVEPLAGTPDSAGTVRAILPMEDGGVMIGLRNGLLRWRDGRCTTITLGDARPKSVSAIAQDAQDVLWVGTFGDGLFALHPDGRVTSYDESDGLLNDNIRGLLADDQGNLWVGSKFGVNRLENERIRAFTVHQGLPNDNIWCILQDHNGDRWFGTDGAGVLRYTGDRFVTYTVKEGLCSDLVMCIVADEQGDLWTGTYGNGICRADAMAMVTTLDGLPNNTVWCGLHDRQGRLWFGTSDGLGRLERGIVVPMSDTAALRGERVLALFEQDDGSIWCGTRSGVSIVRSDGTVHSPMAGSNGPGRSVRAFLRDAHGLLWMATDEGLCSFDGRRYRRLSMADGLCDNTVFTLAMDDRGRLWAGTSNGLACWDGKRFRGVRLGPDFGSNYIDLLIKDGYGTIWAGTNNGLFAFEPDSLLEDGRSVHYTTADGLRSMEFNLNAAFLDRHGRLFLGTTAGILVHDPTPSADTARAGIPELYINGIRSFLQHVDWSHQADSIEGPTGLPAGLRLAYRRNYLTFDYAAIQLAHPERVQYRYRLKGYDQDWLPPTGSRFATYSNLPQGEYTFEVSATSDDRTWSTPVPFSFRILPPFWMRWWFILLVLLTLAALGWVVFRLRERQRKRREKTRQLMLRSRMLQLEQQALNANMNRHFVFNALNSIQYYINRQDRTAANRYLTSFAKLIRKNLDASRNDTTTLAEELERLELYLVLEHMRFKDKFRYLLDVDPALHASGVNIPAMMLQPYVENSIWHGILPMERQGQVSITARMVAGGLIRVVIEDDGVGIDLSRNAKNGASGDHISRGIEITKGRADVLRRLGMADIRIQGPEQLHAADGRVTGTRVTIEVPAINGSEREQGVLRSPDDALIFEDQ